MTQSDYFLSCLECGSLAWPQMAFDHDEYFEKHIRAAMISRRLFILAGFLALSSGRCGEITNAPFSIEQRGGISWLNKPSGERFFSLGVCVVNQGAPSNGLNPTNSGYAAFQHYQNADRWAEATLKRLKSWNITTISAWSD